MREVVAQRAVIVLPSTGEYDSRTWRIATSLRERGHTVTVIARSRPGLPERETDAAGFETIRLQVSATDGLPFAAFVLRIRDVLRAVDARRAARRGRQARARRHAGAPVARIGDPTTPQGDLMSGNLDAVPAVRSLPRRIGARLMTALAIPLTIRSQVRRTRGLDVEADVVHGMAYMGIPVALDLARRLRVPSVYDARDIYLDAGNLARMWPPLRWLIGRSERGWARRASRVATVNDAYGRVMAARWGTPSPLVVMNCSYRYDPPNPRPRRFHETLGLAPETRIILYQGGFSRDRGIEQLIEAIALVPGATLVLMGYGKLEPELRAAAEDSTSAGRVRVLPAVPPNALLDWVASADVVGFPIQPTTLNHRLTTPNKLFEALAVGVPVVASDLPGMAPTVREIDAGILVDPTDPAAIAAACRKLLDEPAEAAVERRTRILAAAHATYNWEAQMERLLDEYGRLTGRPW
jgi:glycosyltransferase involved in cell wall biosynthesis